MLYRVSDFCEEVSSDMNGLIDRLINLTGRSSNAEISAWQSSLPKVSKILAGPELGNYHMYMGESGGLILEYKLPSASSWCDVVLLGNGKINPSAVIIELKDWQTKGDEEGPSETLIKHKGQLLLHPSDQVRGYANYCKRFHSAVMDNHADVSGCVYFTSQTDINIYRSGKYTNLTSEFPIFSLDENSTFTNYLTSKLISPNEQFAHKFENGTYRQDRSLLIQVAKNFKEKTSPFVLLDEQRKGFSECISIIKEVLEKDDKKHVVIVQGPPGSGKSALAANLWAECVELVQEPKTVVFTTTSTSQRKNWERHFRTTGKNRDAKYIVKKSNDYNPGLNTSEWLESKRNQGHAVKVQDWKNNLKLFAKDNRANRAPDDLFFISIVDEAHALIDPAKPGAEGIPPSGWVIHAGPQGWHIMRCSRISIFLMDGDQSYRDNETTTKDDLVGYAKDLGAEVHEIDLSGTQFRCAGSVEYVNWVDTILFNPGENSPTNWRTSKDNPQGKFIFEIIDELEELEDTLLKKFKSGEKVRLAASYAVPWKTKKAADPYSLPDKEKDFCIPIKTNGKTRYWSKIWNYAPNQDYTHFVQAPPESKMHTDPLAEVGCPYVIRGFDYDYLGILWLEDLVWRKDAWKVNPEHIHESAIKNSKAKAKKQKGNAEVNDILIEKILRGYRILLTRALKGKYLWVKDEETREHLKEILYNGNN
ncbi:MAG: DUF2075 domain-containing protein [Ignavibacteria bacterium]|jgi:DUF2075 family protein/DNA replication protein DnaC|nr:DUF2075 domain-containing protein [Ignavibacteria bacterium]MCU7522277.1 DUF2075 domain-containing protein [Ignavibacteria bacterium]